MIYRHLKLLIQVTLNKLTSSILFVFLLTDIIAHSSIIPFLPNVPPRGGKKDLSADINHTEFTEHIL